MLEEIGVVTAVGSRVINISNTAGWTQRVGFLGTWSLHPSLPKIELGLLIFGLALFILGRIGERAILSK